MPERKVHVYRLTVEYPAGSLEPGWEPDGWEPLTGGHDPITGEPYDDEVFRWPQAGLYLSASGARRRGDLLRKYGAAAEVEKSSPVTWPEVAAMPTGTENGQ